MGSVLESAFSIPENKFIYNLPNRNNYSDFWTYFDGKYFAKNNRKMFNFVL